MKLIVATRNQHKLAEIRALLGDAAQRFEILSAKDIPDLREIEESGATMRDNALKKAVETAAVAAKLFRGVPFLVLADDSGLEVDALGGAPGVWSARFAGEDVNYHDNNAKLLWLMAGVADEKRTARFRCVVAIVESGGAQHACGERSRTLVEGVCEGVIGHTERGAHGFGYDPLFIPRGFDKTFAELGEELKNRISHRARALAEAQKILQSLAA